MRQGAHGMLPGAAPGVAAKPVGGGKGDENVSRSVEGEAPGASEAEPARRASRLHWSGVSGASVATTMMIEPSSLGVGWSACSLPGMREVGICLPTGTPLMSRSSRLP